MSPAFDSRGPGRNDDPDTGDVAAIPAAFAPRQLRQLGWITAAAIAVYVGLRLLPTGTNLSHMDFRVDPKAGNAIEFCDPLNPQFIPVVAARSPVALTVQSAAPAIAGREVSLTVALHTSSGKPIAPADLLETHTRRLHLLLVDPTLADYQHVHPAPGERPGEWVFAFTPRTSGTYRIFADFTPAATGRGLYASVDLPVRPGEASNGRRGTARDGYQFTLQSLQQPVRAGQPIDLRFAVRRVDGGSVPLQPVMGAYAHLVAFDEARSGFAHLHPADRNLAQVPDTTEPVLEFKLTIPNGGRYIVWAQVNLDGEEVFAPFTLDVGE